MTIETSRRRAAAALAAALCVALSLALASTASATVTAAAVSGGVLTVTGSAGADAITLSDGTVPSSDVVVEDPGGVPATGGGCTQSSATRTVCAGVSFGGATTNAGASGDTITSSLTQIADTQNGEAGADTLNGGPNGGFFFFGGSTLNGGSENDTLNAGSNGSTMDGGTGADTMNGGASGADAVSYVSRTGNVTATANNVADDGEASEGDNIAASVESISTGSGNDTLVGTASVAPASQFGGTSGLSGGPGNDTLTAGVNSTSLSGGTGDDHLFGGPAPDTLAGGPGNDTGDGGGGDDTLFFDDASTGDADVVNGGAGFDNAGYQEFNAGATAAPFNFASNVSLDDQANDGVGGEGDNVHTDVEDIFGGDNNDTLTGSPASNVITGNAGNDTIDGLGSPDQLLAGVGDDTVNARDQTKDRVSCGEGNDNATTDDVDDVSSCEANAVLAVPAPQPVTVPAPRDTTKAVVALSKLKTTQKRSTFLKSGESFTATPNEAVAFDGEMVGALRNGRIAKAGDLVLASKRTTLSPAPVKFRLKVAKKLRKTLPRRFKIRLVIQAVDAGGNLTTVTRTIKIR